MALGYETFIATALRDAEARLEGKFPSEKPVSHPSSDTTGVEMPLSFLFQIQRKMNQRQITVPTGGSTRYQPMKRSPRVRPTLSSRLSSSQVAHAAILYDLCEEFHLPYLKSITDPQELRQFFRQAALRIHPDHHHSEGAKISGDYAEKFRRLKSSVDILIHESQFEIGRQAA